MKFSRFKKITAGATAAAIMLLLQTPATLIAGAPTGKPRPVAITSTFTSCTDDFSVCTGTFTTSGALGTSGGTVTMLTEFNINFKRAHCLWTFLFADGSTLTIREECTFATSPDRGRWEIESGTGTYANLRGNGSALMPDDITEEWVGFVR